MFNKETRKMFLHHNWLEIVNKGKNPYQTWTRLRGQYQTTITDLVLLAQKLPDGEFQEMFTPASLESLIMAMLQFGPLWTGFPLRHSGKLDRARAQLCAMLIERCVHFCILQCHFLFYDTPSLKEPIEKQLKECISICKDIANKLELEELREKGSKDNLVYLFDWSKVPGDDETKLGTYLMNEIKPTPFVLLNVVKCTDDSSLNCKMGLEGFDDSITVEFSIVGKNKDKGFAIFKDNNLKETKRVKLIIKQDMEHKFVYISKNHLNWT